MNPIPEFNGFYAADVFGNIHSLDRVVMRKNGSVYRVRQRVLSLKTTKAGYQMAHLRAGVKSKTYLAHRLVLSAFLKEPKAPFNFVNHKNGIKADNRLENLEWCTKSENAIHAFSVLNSRRGGTGRLDSLSHLSKPVTAIRIEDGAKFEFKSMKDAQRNGFSISSVSECVNGNQKTHRAMRWTLT